MNAYEQLQQSMANLRERQRQEAKRQISIDALREENKILQERVDLLEKAVKIIFETLPDDQKEKINTTIKKIDKKESNS